MIIAEPKLRALVLWLYEKNVLPVLLVSICLYISSDLLYYSALLTQEMAGIMKDVAFALVVGAFLFLLWKKYATKYYILESHIHLKDLGGWTRIPYEKIENVKLQKGALEGLLKIGKIVIKTPEEEYVLEGVHDPERVFDEIVRRKLEVEGRVEKAFKL